MRNPGNILWHFPFLGFLNALITLILGALMIITVVGAPLGLGLIQLAKFLLSPFSSEMVNRDETDTGQNELWKLFGIFVRIVYFPFGLFLSILTLLEILGLFISIVGIPQGKVLARSLGTFFNPVNKICVSRDMGENIKAEKTL